MSFPPPSDPDESPTLDPTTVADDELLSEAVDTVIIADLAARERMEEVFVYTEALRGSLDADLWRVFMRYDELANGRFAELTLVLAGC